MPANQENTLTPVPLGLKKSFGFGDRLGLATPGHLASNRKFDFAPIFAQQSIREMTRTNRTPAEVMRAAQDTLQREGFTGSWGADADHLKNLDDVRKTSDAGFCLFTIDPSDFVDNSADRLGPEEVAQQAEKLVAEGVFDSPDWRDAFLGRTFEVEDFELVFNKQLLDRAAVKYGRALAHSADMARGIAAIRSGTPYEIEISVDETDTPTTPLEHLFVACELKRREVAVVSLAPRFIGDFEKGIDYRGDPNVFEETLRQHVAIARQYGPYKISVHSGSDKFSIYPIIGRVCGDLLHVKTAGTSYLEALRAVLRIQPALFQQIVRYCGERFEEDRKSYHISTTAEEVADLMSSPEVDTERKFFDGRPGRQLLHVTFGSVLTRGTDAAGKPFQEWILDILENHPDLHTELLEKHFDYHLGGLNKG